MKSFLIGLIVLTMSATVVFSQDEGRVIKGGVLNGKAVSLPKPTYPDEARIAKFRAMVAVSVVIDEAGNVISAKRVPKMKAGEQTEPTEADRLRSLLEEAAEAAALQARFSPTMLSGTPVKVSGQIVYNFVADDLKTTENEASATARVGKNAEAPSPISGGILNEKAVTLPMPSYPPAAAAVNAQGTVSVFVIVDENGDVISASATSGHPLLQAAAVESARKAKFAPTMLNGKLVKVSGVITYNFMKQ